MSYFFSFIVAERFHSIADQGEKWIEGEVRDAVELEPDTRVRLLRKHSLRIVNESNAEENKSTESAAGWNKWFNFGCVHLV